jgi:hypothetical protein
LLRYEEEIQNILSLLGYGGNLILLLLEYGETPDYLLLFLRYGEQSREDTGETQTVFNLKEREEGRRKER